MTSHDDDELENASYGVSCTNLFISDPGLF